MTTSELIARYDLTADVDAFVIKRARELARHPHPFHFTGANHSDYCRLPEPHVPHITGSYQTVRYGHLDDFCLGRSGDDILVVVERRTKGDASTPSEAFGYYTVDDV